MTFNIPNYVFNEASSQVIDNIEPSTDTGESAIGDKIPEKLEPMLFE